MGNRGKGGKGAKKKGKQNEEGKVEDAATTDPKNPPLKFEPIMNYLFAGCEKTERCRKRYWESKRRRI